jgi:dehydrogenase/reductase SDR family protein 1
LKAQGVAVFSLYPGTASTEGMVEYAKYDASVDLSQMETPQFTGRCVAALALDPKAIEDTGGILITAEVAQRYGFTDVDGKQPRSQRPELW